MSCSEVMYQAYYPYLYQRAGAAPPVSAHPVPRTGPFSSPFTAAHQYDRVSSFLMSTLFYLPHQKIYISFMTLFRHKFWALDFINEKLTNLFVGDISI